MILINGDLNFAPQVLSPTVPDTFAQRGLNYTSGTGERGYNVSREEEIQGLLAAIRES